MLWIDLLGLTSPPEKKVGQKASQGIDELPYERKNKLTGVQSIGISSLELVNLKSRSRLSLGAIKDKSGIKGVVKVRNSYKDLFDTEVEDQNKQTKLLKSPTRNGVVNGKNVERNESCVVVSDTQQTQVAPAEAVSHENWVACDRCNAWRLLPIGITAVNLPENWWCSKSTWLPGKNYCDVSEDETTQAVREMNFKISSLNHVIGDTYHANSNANSETLSNGWKKNKYRPKGGNFSQATRNDCNGDYVEADNSNLRCMLDINKVNKRVGPVNIQQILDPDCDPAINLVGDGNPVTRGNRRTLRVDPINILPVRSALEDTFYRGDYYNYTTMWANDADVMKALDVGEGMVKEWLLCNLDIKYNYGKPSMPQYEFNVRSSVAYHERLTKRNCRALIFRIWFQDKLDLKNSPRAFFWLKLRVRGFRKVDLLFSRNLVVYWISQYKLRNDGLAKFLERESD
ncbi:peptidase S10, serine carboxypeptidase, alpha/beta hydrolase fold protein [Tanacetum coccineum]